MNVLELVGEPVDNRMPLISVVTVARNMEDTVADTLRSIAAAKTPDVEYIFIDGASSDRTVDIVKSFGDVVDVLVSEPDKGQYDAISKGFSLARGSIFAWVNADDVLMPWSLKVVAKLFTQFAGISWITGLPAFLDDGGQLVKLYTKVGSYPRQAIANGWFDKTHGGFLQQENMFWTRDLWDRAGGFNLAYGLAADFELWTRFARFADLVPVDVPLAAFRERPGEQRSSRMADRYEQEVAAVKSSLRPPNVAWRIAARRGLVGRALVRSLLSSRSTAITYDRTERSWKLVTRRRSLSRQSFIDLVNESMARRSAAEVKADV